MNSDALLDELFSEAISKGKLTRFVLNGQSMYPTLKEGDALTVKPVSFSEVQFGDILAYQNLNTKKIIVHRVVKTRTNEHGPTIWTAAEAGGRFICDEPLTSRSFHVAKVVAIERGIRKINLMSSVSILKGKVRTFILMRFHFVILIQRKIYNAVDRLLGWGRNDISKN